jgi:hypothetical protein
MSVALLDRAQQQLPETVAPTAERRRSDTSRAVVDGHLWRPPIQARGTRTLDQLITSGWRELASGASVRCPVCHGRMVPGDAVAGLAQGGCLDCGTTLA